MTMNKRQTTASKHPNLYKISLTSKKLHINLIFMVFK